MPKIQERQLQQQSPLLFKQEELICLWQVALKMTKEGTQTGRSESPVILRRMQVLKI